MQLIARILVTNSSRINQKRIINKFGSYLMVRNVSSSTQQQLEKTVEELTKENANLIAKLKQLTQDFIQQKQDFEAGIAQLQKEKEEILKGLGGKKLAEEEETETQKLQKHEMKVKLPLEEWYDFATQIEDRPTAGKGNLQSFLYDGHGDITLGRMEIIPPRDDVFSDRPMMRGYYGSTAVDLPDLPMPANVKNFEGITLTYVDMDVVDFLRKFQQNNLLANVQLDLSYGATFNTLPMLKKILPLISSIYSLTMHELFDWIYGKEDKELKQLLKTIVEQTKILAISRWYTYSSTKCTWEDKFDLCCSWLYTPRDDGKPRTLIADSTIKEPHCSSFINRIKKDFLEADHAISFFIRLGVPEDFQPEISLENNKTNEKLVFKAQAGKHNKQSLLISRHSSNVDKNTIEEEEKEISEWDHYGGPRLIHLTHDWSGY